MKSINDAMMVALMALMREAAEREILPRFGTLSAGDIRSKTGPDDLVTEADIGAEHVLSQALPALLPGIVIVGEEAVSSDAGILDLLASDALVGVIDPVDGTWNFAHGMPLFGSILAIVAGGQTIAGLIHYPVTGDFLVARPGQGAWHVTSDGVRARLAVAPASAVAEMSGFVPLQAFEPGLRDAMAPRLLRFSQTTTWGCSAFEYRMLATGAMSFCLNAELMPWDHAAGVLIHTEAGGFSALLDGQSYRPDLSQGQLLLAPDRASWEAIRAALMDD